MFPLRCSVRGCEQPLSVDTNGVRLSCRKGHSFDRAKQGYWPLVQPQDRHSDKAGDCDAAVDARRRWLETGVMRGFVSNLGEKIDAACFDRPFEVLDLGCGEGTFSRELFADRSCRFCGIELSKKAIKMASRTWPEATWVLANADRTLPVADESVDLVLSVFGRRPTSEIHRVLKPDGFCMVAVPAPNDLVEIRALVQDQGVLRSRTAAIESEFLCAGLECNSQEIWEEHHNLKADAIRDALSMTYRGVRASQQLSQEDLAASVVTISSDVMIFKRRI